MLPTPAHHSATPLIKIENLCKSYSLQDANGKTITNQVLFNINLTIHQGEFVAIMGHSGSGKSTLMNILGCLDTPTSGAYWLTEKNVATLSSDELARIRNRNIGFVFQGFNLLKRMTALDNVAVPLLYAGISRANSRKQALELLRRTGLEIIVSTEHSTYFTERKMAILAEERVGIEVYRGYAFCSVTGI